MWSRRRCYHLRVAFTAEGNVDDYVSQERTYTATYVEQVCKEKRRCLITVENTRLEATAGSVLLVFITTTESESQAQTIMVELEGLGTTTAELQEKLGDALGINVLTPASVHMEISVTYAPFPPSAPPSFPIGITIGAAIGGVIVVVTCILCLAFAWLRPRKDKRTVYVVPEDGSGSLDKASAAAGAIVMPQLTPQRARTAP